jgi:hypothetical protein
MGVFGLWLAAGVGATAILIGTHDAEQQRGVMKGQLETMQAQFTATERPWISVDSIHIPAPLFFDANDEITMLLQYRVANSGRTPAIYVMPMSTAAFSKRHNIMTP